jgi:hypothetical protein
MKNLDELLLLQEDELLEELGSELSTHQAIPRSPYELRTVAQIWLRSNIKQFKNTLCGSERICLMVKRDTDLKEIILAVCDLLISLQFGVSPLTVSVLIVKSSLKKLCNDDWVKIGWNDHEE